MFLRKGAEERQSSRAFYLLLNISYIPSPPLSSLLLSGLDGIYDQCFFLRRFISDDMTALS
jgi:hypothetical protein